MARGKAIAEETRDVDVMLVERQEVDFYLLGRTPLICNRMSEKAKRIILSPRGRKTAAEKAATLKHDPHGEYRDSVYTLAGESVATRIVMPAVSFKGAMGAVAVDLPGMAKAQVGRWCFVRGEDTHGWVHVYGVPRLLMSVVRSADINHTPDIRTRAIIAEWACRLTVAYSFPLLRDRAVANLMANAGLIIGVGDWRQGKGAGDYGQWELVGSDNEAWQRVVRDGGRDAQDAALAEPTPYDEETADLLTWYVGDRQRRGFVEVA